MQSAFLLLLWVSAALSELTACDVLCSGPILAAVSTVDPPIYNDSKTFVDLVLLYEPDVILNAFKAAGPMNSTALFNFTKKYFADGHGTDVLPWIPRDFPDEIPLFSKITDPVMSDWARQVHEIWKMLGREQDADVALNPQRHTLLPLKHPYMIVPGGRFIEFYYWDSYWIIKGLLVSQMNATAVMVVDNLLGLANATGFVPNGSRRYYLGRSQPPYLALMVDLLWQAGLITKDFLTGALDILAREHDFWMTMGKHAVTVHKDGKDYVLNRFYSDSTTPRPEMARQDMNTASAWPPEQQPRVYSQLAAGAETGWDFSSRWLGDGKTLSSIDTTNVIPPDLNGLLYKVEKVLDKLYTAAGVTPAKNFSALADKRAIAIREVLWDEQTVQWRDFNLSSGIAAMTSHPSNYLPIWSGCFSQKLYGVTIEDIAQSFLSTSGLMGPGGVCTSLSQTGQQWDYPNLWPPIQSMLAEGFMAGGDLMERAPTSRGISLTLGTSLIQSAFVAFNRTSGYMLEKYNCSQIGAIGGGGEYVLQKGFGWTNGAVLSLLDMFPNTPPPPTEKVATNNGLHNHHAGHHAYKFVSRR